MSQMTIKVTKLCADGSQVHHLKWTVTVDGYDAVPEITSVFPPCECPDKDCPCRYGKGPLVSNREEQYRVGDKENPVDRPRARNDVCDAAEGYQSIGEPDLADAALEAVEDMSKDNDNK